MKLFQIFLIVSALVMISCETENFLELNKDLTTIDLFKLYHSKFEKKYDLNSEEGLRRYLIFEENFKMIQETNDQNLSYQLGVNQFTDYSAEEFKNLYLMNPLIKMRTTIEMLKFFEEEEPNQFLSSEGSRLLKYSPVDWTDLFLPPRDQGDCGSCWAFASAGIVEAAYAQKYNHKEYLSTQQLVACDKKDSGCNGGDFKPALKYIKGNGLVKDSDYPYHPKKKSCNLPEVNTTKITDITYCSNNLGKKCTVDIVYDMLKNGPVGVGMDGNAIMNYSKGIFSGKCKEDNHAVILIGYGIENDVEYWILRNSWGTSWGMKGYFRIARKDSNKSSCFVTNEAFSVNVE